MDYSQVSDTEYKTDASDSKSLTPVRRDRFDGAKSTWRTNNEDEITLTDSLIQLEAQNLSAHLYNTHAMKQRLYDTNLTNDLKSWASKDRWRPKAKKGEIDDGANFVPPRKWTAWPLEPRIVPRAGEERKRDKDEVFTLRKREPARPSRELEEVLTGVVLKLAKDNFEEREWETEEEGSEDGGGESTDEIDTLKLEEEGSEDGGGESTDEIDALKLEDDWGGTLMEYQDWEAPARASVEKAWNLKPIISADDERSTKLLRPTIRHTLSRLDSLLHALHLSRQACLRKRRGVDHESLANPSTAEDLFTEPTTKTEIDIDTSNPPSPKRSVGRPRIVIEYPSDHQVISPPKKSNRGRKKKIHLPREGETQGEMMVRVAREQHKALPFGSRSPAKRKRSCSVGRGARSVSTQKRVRRSSSRGSSGGQGPRLAPRDWSSVIGTAALVGFPPDVLDRAAKRCALLFGEGMTMRVFTEGPAGGEEKEVLYAPDEIPDFSAQSLVADDKSLVVDDKSLVADHKTSPRPSPAKRRSARPTRASSRATTRASSRATNLSRTLGESPGLDVRSGYENFELYAAYCPLPNCARHTRGFKNVKALRSHLRLGHKMEAGEVESTLAGIAAEMDGGVHRDGFGRMVTRKVGWRGADVGKRKR